MEHDRWPSRRRSRSWRRGSASRCRTRAAPTAPRAAPIEPLYELMARVATFYARDARARAARARVPDAPRSDRRRPSSASASATRRTPGTSVLRRFGAQRQRAPAARRRRAHHRARARRRSRDGERHYDRFRDRLMFPIRDARGRVIAFGGRIIDAGEPKYLNSPETALFHKGRELYGLYEARRARANLKRLLVVEGYMDTVRLHQAGIDYAVATLGTATTAEHLRRLFRLVQRGGVRLRRRSRRPRGRLARAAAGAAGGARGPRDPLPVPAARATIRTRWSGRGRREAFEARLRGAVPLSEYLVRELSRAERPQRTPTAARALPQPRGRCSRRCPRASTASCCSSASRRSSGSARRAAAGALGSARRQRAGARRRRGAASAAAPRPCAPAAPAAAAWCARRSCGCCITRPSPPRSAPAERAGLDASDEPGIGLLRELLDDLRGHPAQIPAQVIERWARPDRRRSPAETPASARRSLVGRAGRRRELQAALGEARRQARRRAAGGA